MMYGCGRLEESELPADADFDRTFGIADTCTASADEEVGESGSLTCCGPNNPPTTSRRGDWPQLLSVSDFAWSDHV